jgi:hypothetical protein
MVVNATTGYLEAGRNYKLTGFNSEEKIKFLEMYAKTGDISACMGALQHNPNTFQMHIRIDPKFKADFETVRRAMKHELEGVIFANAKTPKGFMDRMAWLRRNYPDEYGMKTTVEHKVNRQQIDSLYESVIEAEIVEPAKLEDKGGE